MRTTVTVGLLLCALSGAAAGQRGQRGQIAGGQPQRGARGAGGGDRAQLEMQLEQKFARRARMVLGLDDSQMVKLGGVRRRFIQQERAINQQDMQTRRALREALTATASPDQDKKIGELHEQLTKFEQQRMDLNAAEQKELAGFMTNSQRVRFQAMQENFRRQIQSLATDGAPPIPGAGRGRPPQQ